ncbi:MAG: glycosyltransferase family 4 protein, partial [Lysobacter sp.]
MSALPTVADPIEFEAAPVEPAPQRQVRLLLLTDTPVLAAGGSERFLRNLVTQLPGDRYQITVIQLSDQLSEDIQLAPVFARPNVTVRALPVDGAAYGPSGWRAWRTLRDLLRRERFDIVQSHHEKADLLNA